MAREALDASPAIATIAATLREHVSSGRSVAIDFRGIDIATQSFLHALLFHALRVGWAVGAKVYVKDASSAVRSGLDYLESYALR